MSISDEIINGTLYKKKKKTENNNVVINNTNNNNANTTNTTGQRTTWQKVLDVILGINKRIVGSKSEVPTQTTNTKNFITVQNNNTQSSNITNPSTTKTNNKVLAPTVQIPTTQNSQISPIYAKAQKTIAPLPNTEYKLSKSTEEAKKIKSGDMYKLTEGEIDDRNRVQKLKDDVTGIAGNILMGVEGVIPNVAKYVDAGGQYIAKKGLEEASKGTLAKIIKDEEVLNNLSKAIGEEAGTALWNTTTIAKQNKELNNKERQEWRDKIIQENIDKTTNPLTQKLAEIAPAIGNNAVPMAVAALPVPGARALSTGLFMTSAGGSYLEDAQKRGMTEGQSIGYATIMGLLEGRNRVSNIWKYGQ